MELEEKIKRAFSTRLRPVRVGLAYKVLPYDFEPQEALWFSGRDWHDLTWKDWKEHSSAVYFFNAEAFCYYLPSVLILSAQNPNEALDAAESLINELDRSPDVEGWTDEFANRFLGFNQAELKALKEWLLQVCEYVPYRGWGIARSGPGDRFGRAFDTIELIEKEIERIRSLLS